MHKVLNNSTLPETTIILHLSLSSENLLKKFITSIPVIFGKSKSKSKTSGFISKYLKNSKKLKQAQNDFEDFNNSLENEQIKGDDYDAKTR